MGKGVSLPEFRLLFCIIPTVNSLLEGEQRLDSVHSGRDSGPFPASGVLLRKAEQTEFDPVNSGLVLRGGNSH